MRAVLNKGFPSPVSDTKKQAGGPPSTRKRTPHQRWRGHQPQGKEGCPGHQGRGTSRNAVSRPINKNRRPTLINRAEPHLLPDVRRIRAACFLPARGGSRPFGPGSPRTLTLKGTTPEIREVYLPSQAGFPFRGAHRVPSNLFLFSTLSNRGFSPVYLRGNPEDRR